MSPELLRRTGEALYGPRWQTQLALELDVADRTVRRWIAGVDVPAGVRLQLCRLVRERGVRLMDLAVQLDAAG